MLACDTDLLMLVDPAQRAAASRASMARVLRAPVGTWTPARHDGGIGLLVLEGLLLHRSHWGQRASAELLGPGDLVRPWEGGPDAAASVELREQWRVLIPARLAILDAAWAMRTARWPELASGLTGRVLARARRTLEVMAIDQVRRLDERVLLLLWRIADRFGEVHLDGVHLELPLTHQQLAELAGARRPSLSAAIARLTREGRLRQHGASWVLTGPPPDPDYTTTTPHGTAPVNG